MNRLFKSPALQEEFDKNGFVHVPFLTSVQAGSLLDFYRTIEAEHDQIGLPFTTTSQSNDHKLIRKANEEIAKIFKPAMDDILCNYHLLFGNFLIKKPGPDSATPLHQDTTFVDETKFASISIWVSLQDTDQSNGCMRFVKGSHKFRHILRPTHAYPWPFEPVRVRLEKKLIDYPSRKGEAFIFHHALIHASYPNLTTTPRVAAVMAAYPSDAQLLLLFMEKGSQTAVQKYKMTNEAYLHFIKGEPPAMGELIDTELFVFDPVTPAEFDKITGSTSSIVQKIKQRLAIFIRS
jgi:hypothetical protein